MLKRLLLIALFMAGFMAGYIPIINAAPEVYTYEYSSTNFYADQGFEYEFSGLDVATEYQWKIVQLNLNGQPVGELYNTTISGVAAYDWAIVPFKQIFAPFRVEDKWGKILSYHIVHPQISSVGGVACDFDTLSTPVSAHDSDDKTLLFSLSKEGVGGWQCANDTTTDTVHPRENPEYVTASDGDYFIIHYRWDSVANPPLNDILEFKDLSDSSTVLTLPMDLIIEWNQDAGYTGSVGDTDNNFVILTTDGQLPAWIDAARDLSVFAGNQSPHFSTLSYGAYDYARFYGGIGTAYTGESLALRSRGQGRTEWVLSGDGEVEVGEKQTVTVESATEEIWQGLQSQEVIDYSGADPSADIFSGTLSASYHESATVSYTTPGSADTSDNLIVWYIDHGAALPYSESDIYGFQKAGSYDIVGEVSPVTRGIALLTDNNAFTQFDRLLVFLSVNLLMFIVLWRLNAIGAAYCLIYAGLGTLAILMGLFELKITLVLGLTIIAALAGAVASTRAAQEN